MDEPANLPSDAQRMATLRRLAELEAMTVELSMPEVDPLERLEPIEGRTDRRRFEEAVQFTGEVRLRSGLGINLSREGLCLVTEERLVFPLSFRVNGRIVRRRALLSWLRRGQDGAFELGFEFEEPLGHHELGESAASED